MGGEETVGGRVRRLRTAKGLTQRDLAHPDYTHSYVSQVEAGRRTPSRQALAHFAAKLGVEPEELETGRRADLVATLELLVQEARSAISDGRFEEAGRALNEVDEQARRHRLPRLEAKAAEGRGLWFERRGDPEQALGHFQAAEDLLTSEPPTARVDAVAGKARCFEALGDIRYAMHLLESLLSEIERLELADPDALARLHASLVYAYLETGLYSRAVDSAAELDRLLPRVTDPTRAAQMHMNVARLYLVQGHTDDALRSLQRAEDAYRQSNLQTEAGGAHLARGYVLSREGRRAEARGELARATDIFESTANNKDLARSLNELARVERLEGNLDGATTALERSLGLIGESDIPIAAWAHRELGLTLSDSDPAAAEKHVRTAIDYYERSEQSIEIAITYRVLGDLLSARDEAEAGCHAYRTGILALESRS